MAIINHKINRLNDEGEVFESFNLYIPEDYTLGGSNVIIVKESATGDGGVVINNGRSHEEIPVNGTLFAVDTRKNVKSVVVSRGNSSSGRTTSLIPQGRNVEASERLDLLNSNMQKLMRIKDNGELINFITPFKHRLGSNQYYIKDLKFTTQFDDSSVGFSMIISENRSANILENDVSLGVKNGYFDALLALLERESGIISSPYSKEIEEIQTEINFIDNVKEQQFTEALDWSLNAGRTQQKQIEKINQKYEDGEISKEEKYRKINDLRTSIEAKNTPEYALQSQYYLGRLQATRPQPVYIDISNIKINNDQKKDHYNFAQNYGSSYPLPMSSN